ncbi:hypothetical protein [Chromobacterium phragmitis]|uniref:hypothetical protein n=1 Tax=Chromobacterium phragmitis TaxID=2202141 RepID=UPI0038782B7D
MLQKPLGMLALALWSAQVLAADPQAGAGQFQTGSANDPRLAVSSAGSRQAPAGAQPIRKASKDPLQRAMDADPVFGAVVKDAVPFDPGQIKLYRRQVERVEKLRDSPSVAGEQKTIPVRAGQTVDVNVAVGYPLTLRLTDVAGQPVKIAGNVPGLAILSVYPIPGDAQGAPGPGSGNGGGSEAKDAIVIDPVGSGATTVTIFPSGSFRPVVVRVRSSFPKGGKGDEYQTPLSGALLSVLKETVGDEMVVVAHSGGDALRVWKRISDGHYFIKMRPGVTLLSPRNFRTTTRDDDGGVAYEFDYRPASVVAGVGGASRAIVIR